MAFWRILKRSFFSIYILLQSLCCKVIKALFLAFFSAELMTRNYGGSLHLPCFRINASLKEVDVHSEIADFIKKFAFKHFYH
jgi:hypothetical protein